MVGGWGREGKGGRLGLASACGCHLLVSLACGWLGHSCPLGPGLVIAQQQQALGGGLPLTPAWHCLCSQHPPAADGRKYHRAASAFSTGELGWKTLDRKPGLCLGGSSSFYGVGFPPQDSSFHTREMGTGSQQSYIRLCAQHLAISPLLPLDDTGTVSHNTT